MKPDTVTDDEIREIRAVLHRLDQDRRSTWALTWIESDLRYIVDRCSPRPLRPHGTNPPMPYDVPDADKVIPQGAGIVHRFTSRPYSGEHCYMAPRAVACGAEFYWDRADPHPSPETLARTRHCPRCFHE